MRAALVLVLLAGASLATASVARAVAGFTTPKKAAYCGFSEGEPPINLICWRPGDGLTLNMTRAGQPRRRVTALNRG
jgi:hypothetical protein